MLLGIIAGVVSTGCLYFIYKLAEQTLMSSFTGLGAFVPSPPSPLSFSADLS